MQIATITHAMIADGMPTARPIIELNDGEVEVVGDMQLAVKKNAKLAQYSAEHNYSLTRNTNMLPFAFCMIMQVCCMA